MLRCSSSVAIAAGMALACASPWGSEPGTLEPSEPAPAVRETSTLTYREQPGGAYYTPWEPGDRLSLGVDGANLREQPSTESAVAALLEFGSKVTVEGVASSTVELLGRQNRWYQVKTDQGKRGYLFGALLTPLLLTTDFDGDGLGERLSVTFSPDFVPRVRVMEPSFDEKDDRVVALDLPMFAGGRGGRLAVELLQGQQTPWKVFHIELCADDGCDSQLVAYLLPKPDALGYLSSVDAKPEDVRFNEDGFSLTTHEAPFINAHGLLSDGPCEDCDRLLVDRYEAPEVLIDYSEPGERDAGPRLFCETTGRITDGWHKGGELVSCSAYGGTIYLVARKDRWLLVSEDSAHVASFVERRGVEVEPGERFRIDFEA